MKRYTYVILIILSFVNLQAQVKSIKMGERPPKFNFTIINPIGIDSLELEELSNRAIILDFWATWCAPCVKSFPHLNKLIAEYKDKPLTVISITYEPKEFIEHFLKKYELKSTIAIDNDFYMFRKYNGWAIPTMILINSKGKYAGRIHPKNLTEDIIDQLINGEIPKVEQVPEDLYDPLKTEKYFRKLLKEDKK